MGFMDKVKSQATTIAGKAQEQAKVGQEKFEKMQAKRQSDALLAELGGIVYKERTGQSDPSSAARADELVARLKDFEAKNGTIQVSSVDGDPGVTGSFVPTGTRDSTMGASAASPSGDTLASSSGDTLASTPAPPSGGIPTASYASDEDEGEA